MSEPHTMWCMDIHWDDYNEDGTRIKGRRGGYFFFHDNRWLAFWKLRVALRIIDKAAAHDVTNWNIQHGPQDSIYAEFNVGRKRWEYHLFLAHDRETRRRRFGEPMPAYEDCPPRRERCKGGKSA